MYSFGPNRLVIQNYPVRFQYPEQALTHIFAPIKTQADFLTMDLNQFKRHNRTLKT